MRAAILVLAFAGCARWTKTDTALEAAFVTAQVLDYRQTSEAVQYGGEANQIIGASGQNVSPAGYFLTTTLLHVFVATVLPRYWRETFQAATIGMQGYRVYDNVDAIDTNRRASCAARAGHSNPCF